MNEATREDVDYLLANPSQASNFDKQFGEGAAEAHINPPQVGAVENEDDGGFIDGALDLGAAVVDGLSGAVNESAKFARSLPLIPLPNAPAVSVNDVLGKLGVNVEALDERDPIPSIYDKEEAMEAGALYQVPKGISQFAFGLLGLGKLKKGAQIAKGGETLLRKAGTALMDGAIVDFTVFDPHDPRFANMIQDLVPELDSDIVDFLAADPEDSDAEGRMKNAIEGSLLGLGGEALFGTLRLFKAGYRRYGPSAKPTNAAELARLDGDIEARAGDLETLLPKERRVEINDAIEASPEASKINVIPLKGVTAVRGAPPIDFDALTADFTRAALTADHAPDYLKLSPKGQRAFNWDKMGADLDVKAILDATAKHLAPVLETTLGKGKQSWDEVRDKAAKEMADMLDEGYAPFAEKVARLADTSNEQAQILVAGKTIMQSLADQISRDSRVLTLRGADVVIQARVDSLSSALVELAGNVKAIQSGSARATRAGGINTGTLARLAASSGNPKATLQALKGSYMHRGMNMINEAWMNAILSGPKTHGVNVGSNAIQAVVQPTAKFIGGMPVIGTNNPEIREQAVAQLASLHREMADSWRMAVKALKTGDNIIDVGHGTDDRAVKHAISAEAIGKEGTPVGSFVNAIGTVLRIPSRFLLAEDEFFKQLNFRAEMAGRLTVEGRRAGLEGPAIRDFIEREMDTRVLDAMGNLRKNAAGNLDKDVASSLEASRYATFTQDLAPGSASAKYSEWVSSMPILRQLSPFVRTPANILKMGATMTPGARHLVSDYKLMMASGDPELVAKATGMARMGDMVWISAITLASNGMITGGGPQDPAKRKLWFDAGHRPYSLKIGGEFISYQRLDPLSLPLSIMADYTEITGTMEKKDAAIEEIVSTVGLAVGKTMLDRTYLQGWGELFELMGSVDNPERAASIARRRGASFQPFSSLTRQIAAEVDPVLREQHTLLAAFKAQVPGLSATLPPRRSWLTGEEIKRPEFYMNPLTVEPFDPNPVAQELVDLGHAFQPPEKTLGGVELSDEQYSRYTELNGTVRINGRTLSANLQRLFDSQRYKTAPAHQQGVETQRLRLTRRIIERHRKKARVELKREDEALREQIKLTHRSEISARSSDPVRAQSGIETLLNLKR